jgi:hypothetical protein
MLAHYIFYAGEGLYISILGKVTWSAASVGVANNVPRPNMSSNIPALHYAHRES